ISIDFTVSDCRCAKSCFTKFSCVNPVKSSTCFKCVKNSPSVSSLRMLHFSSYVLKIVPQSDRFVHQPKSANFVKAAELQLACSANDLSLYVAWFLLVMEAIFL